MRAKSIIVILILVLTSCEQSDKINCEITLQKTPYFARSKVNSSQDSLQMDLDILKSCGNLDSIDSELFTAPMIGVLMVNNLPQDKKITYNSILKIIYTFKKTDDYKKCREGIVAFKKLENKIVDTKEFEKDKNQLIKSGIDESELAGFKAFIRSNISRKLTYKETFAEYLMIQQKSHPQSLSKIEFIEFSDIVSA